MICNDFAIKNKKHEIYYIFYFRKIHSYSPREIESYASQEDFDIELRGPFHNSRSVSERGASRSRASSGCLSDRYISSEKSYPIVANEKPDLFNHSLLPNSIHRNFDDSVSTSQINRRRWEEDRSIIFRHKLQESKNLTQVIGDTNPKLGRKPSLNLSSIDKLDKHCKVGQNEENCRPSVILYSYQIHLFPCHHPENAEKQVDMYLCQ